MVTVAETFAAFVVAASLVILLAIRLDRLEEKRERRFHVERQEG